MKEWRKLYCANTNKKKAGVAGLISDKAKEKGKLSGVGRNTYYSLNVCILLKLIY